jgi:hypothetical protein
MLSYGIMKQVLSLLTAFALFQTQTWALSGGPVFEQAASPNFAGTYSGVMVEKDTQFGDDFAEPNSGSTSNRNRTSGNIGVYTVVVPTTGLSTGSFFLFINGTLYSGGTINGLADPDKGTFVGVMTASATFLDPLGGTQTVPARGQMKTKIIEQRNKPLPGRPDLTTGVAARMEGKAVVDAFDFTAFNLAPVPVVRATYSVSGFRQTTTPL